MEERAGADRRTRSSLYIRGANGERIVIDTGPEFRLQAVRAGIVHLDLVLLTHAHADHVHGLDDLRQLTRLMPLPVYGNGPTLEDVRERFAYIWRKTQRGGGKPRLELREADGPFAFGGLVITPVPVKHGSMDILGWKIAEGGVEAAYITDCSHISPRSLDMLRTVSVLVLDALRMQPHETHFSFAQALETAAGLNAPKLTRVFLTHISHEHSHAEITAYCERWLAERGIRNMTVAPAYDGLEIDI